jgi:hypothetical protein
MSKCWILTKKFFVRGKIWEKHPHPHSPPPPLSVVCVSNTVLIDQDIDLLVLPLPPMEIHPDTWQVQGGSKSCTFYFLNSFEGVRRFFWIHSHTSIGSLFSTHGCTQFVLWQLTYTYGCPFLGGSASSKTKNYGRGTSLNLLVLRESSFHPMKLPESTLLAKGYFLPSS